jgi:hypothetical protein
MLMAFNQAIKQKLSVMLLMKNKAIDPCLNINSLFIW